MLPKKPKAALQRLTTHLTKASDRIPSIGYQVFLCARRNLAKHGNIVQQDVKSTQQLHPFCQEFRIQI